MSAQPRTLTINSRDRTLQSPGSTDFYVNIIPGISYASKFTLINAVIPNTTYNVQATNDTIYWQEAGPVNYSATIAPGSYSITVLLSTVVAAMNAIGTPTYTATYNPVTYLATFANTTTTFAFTFGTHTTNSIGRNLGFTTNGTLSAMQIGNASVQLADPLYFYIKIDSLTSGCRGSNNVDYGAYFVVNGVNPNGDLSFFNEGNNYNVIELGNNPITLNTLHCELKTWNNQLVSLNGTDWNFTIKIDYPTNSGNNLI